jgi:hypothetical protein
MRDDEIIGLVVALAIGVVVLAVYAGLIVLGVSIAKRKNRSPHWMWFSVHPVGLLITLIVMACLSSLKRCPHCAQTSHEHARLCGFCGYDYVTGGFIQQQQQQQPVYIPPQRY